MSRGARGCASGTPNGTRTRVSALKGRCPNRWTMGAWEDRAERARGSSVGAGASRTVEEGLQPVAPFVAVLADGLPLHVHRAEVLPRDLHVLGKLDAGAQRDLGGR